MMFGFGYKKKPSILYFGALVAVFVSCNNPFTSNMGERPAWERPTISNISPASNELLTGEVRFRGEAWAHRDLQRIEIRIGRNTTEDRTEDGSAFDDTGNQILDWMDITRLRGNLSRADSVGGIDGNWEFTLDTLALPEDALKAALSDGFVRIRFRVFDNTPYPVMSQELVYNVKNLPSQVTMALPADEAIRESNSGNPFRIASGAPIQGRVTDLRGLALGYPMIQIWPIYRHDISANPDDFASHERYGLASMFLNTLVPADSVNDDIETGYYANRDQTTVNVANFQFRLNSFTIAPSRDDNVREAVFEYENMTGGYYFRIITKDAQGIVGHFPPYGHGTDQEDTTRPGEPVALYIVNDAISPVIEIDNSDRTEAQLAARPNIYLTTGINERIIALDDPEASPRPVFRLRTLAKHSEGISGAYLFWEQHATGRRGQFSLDGQPRIPGNQTEVYFTFLADQDTLDDDGNLIFTTHPTPYILTLRVLSRVGSWGERSFSLIMDGEAPRVEIRPSIRGAVAPPAGTRLPMHGGFINDNHITVNGNIQVSVDRTASPPIMFDGDNQMVKWFVEPIPSEPDFIDNFLDDPLTYAPDSILARLVAFQRGPSQDNLAFFFDNFDGLVSMPITTGSVPHDAYGTHNFKFDTSPYDGQDLWLYVVAMNQVHNIGFAMQRIRVDQSTDIPVIEMPGFSDIGTLEGLKVTVTGDLDDPDFGGNWPRQNILSGDQGISIRVTDDDGITKDAEHIIITITDPSTGVSAVLDDDKLRATFQGTPKAWSGTLSQETMAAALRAEGLAKGATRLPDGIYRFDLKIWDSKEFKVRIDNEPIARQTSEAVFWFAVHNRIPDVTVISPENNSLQSAYGIDIVGTAKSPFRLERLWITFDPEVMIANPDDPDYHEMIRSYLVDLYIDADFTQPAGSELARIDGLYTYHWRVSDVSFTPGFGDYGPERRNFTLRAFDSLGFMNAVVPNWVRVDVEPPILRFTGFNQGRPLGPDGDEFEVWGNVHFAVNVTDTHGLGSEALPHGLPPDMADENFSNTKWWLLRYDAPSPNWDTPFPIGQNGTGGRFLFRGDLSATFEAVFDSRVLADKEVYKLYVIARDAAGNERRERLDERGIDRIRVNQAADLPELDRHIPMPGVVLRPDAAGNLRITGLARDTDGLDPAAVEIQFFDDMTWGAWLPISGNLDGTGAIDFAFDIITDGKRNSAVPGTGDGTILYRIRVRDEWNTIEGRTRSKNPQIDSNGNTIFTFLTGDPDNPLPNIPLLLYATYIRERSFILDTTAPVIDLPPQGSHLFSCIASLLAEFPGGTVVEENLLFFDVTFGASTFRLLDSSSTGSEHHWNWDLYAKGENVNVLEELKAWFDEAGQGLQAITFVAEDKAGNRSSSINWNFTKDTQAPTVHLANFNQGRPVRFNGNGSSTGAFFEVWGNVHFTINVFDLNGLGFRESGDHELAEVKWWILPIDAPKPTVTVDAWQNGINFPTGIAGRGGQFFAQEAGNFSAVFDSSSLQDGDTYTLWIIARDLPGNQTDPISLVQLTNGQTGKIVVNQAADFPELYQSRLVPPNNVVRRPVNGILNITGVASDIDGFDPESSRLLGLNTGDAGFDKDTHSGYVQIRFANDDAPIWRDEDWINVSGFVNTAGELYFTFDLASLHLTDGLVRYQIRITDEAGDIPGSVRNKNPQIGMGNTFYPIVDIPSRLPATRIFPNETGSFSLVLDTTDPVIHIGDANPIIPSSFSRVDDLLEVLHGEIAELNLLSLSINFGGTTVLLWDNPAPRENYGWDLRTTVRGHSLTSMGIVVSDSTIEWVVADGATIGPNTHILTIPALAPVGWSSTHVNGRIYGSHVGINNGTNGTIRRVLDPSTTTPYNEDILFEIVREISATDHYGIDNILHPFARAPQGPQNLMLMAIDRAGNDAARSWSFIKDTEGPRISFDGLSRAVINDPPPALDYWPVDWPLDWPQGNRWHSEWEEDFRKTIAGWPSDFALQNRDEIIARINLERSRTPSVVMNHPHVISGEFFEALSSLPWDGNDQLTFRYRFNGGARPHDADDAVWYDDWYFGTASQGSTHNYASWSIALGTGVTKRVNDGLNTLDMIVYDTAGNRTELLGLRFIVDRDAPFFFVGDLDNPERPDIGLPNQDWQNNPDLFRVNWNIADSQSPDWVGLNDFFERVFSAADVDAHSDALVFQLRGRVHDVNLRNLTARISSDGLDPYVVLARTYTDPTSQQPPDTEDGSEGLGHRRLVLDFIEAGVWEWTLDLLERDVYALRNRPDSNDGTHRHITLTATDLAGRTATPQWFFFLDGTRPAIHFTGDQTIFDPVNVGALPPGHVFLEGSASDDTGIKDVRAIIARWDYSVGAWRWWDGNDWSRNERPEPPSDPDAPRIAGGWFTVATGGPGQRMVPWTVTREMLETHYPALFGLEGQYRIDVIARDRSLGGESEGNPTVPVPEDFYNWTTNLLATRRFFVDHGAPLIVQIGDNTERRFFNTNPGTANLMFAFNASDGNTVPGTGVSAAVYRGGWGVARPIDLIGFGGNDWDIERELTLDLAHFISGLNQADFGDGSFTLILTVSDPAGRAASYTRNFVVDNQPPTLEVTTQQNDTVTFAGRVTIRGSTIEPSGQIEFVEYALIPAPQYDWLTMNPENLIAKAANLPLAAWRDGKWNNDINNPILEMAEGAGFSWTIDIPNTRHITRTGSLAANYAPIISPRPSNLTWGGEEITYGDVYLVALAVRARDAAGNTGFTVRPFWIYPEGDRPTVEIGSPRITEDEGTFLTGRFTLSGMARDNERVQNVFFRVLSVNNADTPFSTLSVSQNLDYLRFHGESGPVPPGAVQSPITLHTYDAAGVMVATEGWFIASGGERRDAFWTTAINSCGTLNNLAGGTNPIRIEVVAADATEIAPGNWDLLTPMVSRTDFVYATVVSGAPQFTGEELTRFAFYDGAWVPSDEWGRPASTHIWGTPDQIHIGGSGRAQFRFTATHTTPIAAIRYQQTHWDPVTGNFSPTGSVINLLESNDYTEVTYYHHLAALNAGNAYHTNANPGIAVRAEHAGLRVLITVDVNTDILANGAFSNASAWFDLFISAVDQSMPNPIVGHSNVRLPINNTSPDARYELTIRPAGSAAIMGGSASTGAGARVGGVDRVVVWFERRLEGLDEYQGISWYDGKIFDNWNFSVPVPDPTPNDPTRMRQQRMPFIPALDSWDSDEGRYAIVIHRNNPHGGGEPTFGNVQNGIPVRTGWAPGGLDQIWNFTIDSFRMASGPIEMHYVVFDRAGNANHFTQQLIIMNHAPEISEIQLATALRNSVALQSQIREGHSTAVNVGEKGTGLFGRIRNYGGHLPTNETGVQRDIRMGIAPIEGSIIGTGRGHLTRGARHHVGNFTARNDVFALGVETLGPPDSRLQRNFRVEYVSGATLLNGPAINIRAGRVYVIQNPSNVPWQGFGAGFQVVFPGYAFLAATDGTIFTTGIGGHANASVWELNSHYFDPHSDDYTQLPWGLRPQNLELPDVYFDAYNIGDVGSAPAGHARRAEFAYLGAAFGLTPGESIIDFDARENDNSALHKLYSLFIVRVFDGPERDNFGDFTLLSIRVNNSDRTAPFAQLYDLNPNAEHHAPRDSIDGFSDDEIPAGIAPTAIGGNRTRGGLWRYDPLGNLSRPGNIEPRRINVNRFPYNHYQHSLTAIEMGQAVFQPVETVNPDAFFDVDTVSGRVILRGYAEDDQRVGGVRIEFRNPDTGDYIDSVTILESPDTGFSDYGTGLLQPARNDVFFVDSLDLYRHRVEWAFVWDTASIPEVNGNPFVVGDFEVRTVAFTENYESRLIPVDAPERQDSNLPQHIFDPAINNPGFLDSLYRYNAITLRIRPYITGFRRDLGRFFNHTRSLQGRYLFARGENVAVTGFNLGGGSTAQTQIALPDRASVGAEVSLVDFFDTSTTTGNANFNLPSAEHSRFRVFNVPDTAVTGNDGTVNGIVRLRVERDNRQFYAINTFFDIRGSAETPDARYERPSFRVDMDMGNWVRVPHIQPWNTQRFPRITRAGTDLWDNVIRVHVWSDGDTENPGSFPSEGNIVFGTSMSIDPRQGTLHASHNESLGTTGRSFLSTHGNRTANTNPREAIRFIDPIMQSNIFVNYEGEPWVVSSVIGRNGSTQGWDGLGGLFVTGPNGVGWGGSSSTPSGQPTNYFGTMYHVESTWYNASIQNSLGWPTSGGAANRQGGLASPPTTEQFWNPRVVTFRERNIANTVVDEHIHVAYFDSNTNSIKYRYNRRNQVNTDFTVIDASNEVQRHSAINIAALRPWGLGSISFNTNDTTLAQGNAVRRLWTNLDGGIDYDDIQAAGTAFTEGSTITITDGSNLAPTFTGGGQGANARVWFTGTTAGTVAYELNRPGSGSMAAGDLAGPRVVNHSTASTGTARSRNAGEFNDIAVTAEGFPVIVYFDAHNQRLRMAISNSVMPVHGDHWHIVNHVIPHDNARAFGTGQYVSMRIDTRNNENIVHISALTAANNLVYIRGRITPPSSDWDAGSRHSAWDFHHAVVVDSVGTVGRRSTISLDEHGNPWIAYFDEANAGSMDGVKVAFFDPNSFGRVQKDIHGGNLTGWETMHVPAGFRVQDRTGLWSSRLGMENFPTRNHSPQDGTRRFWAAAVGFPTDGPFRVAFWVE